MVDIHREGGDNSHLTGRSNKLSIDTKDDEKWLEWAITQEWPAECKKCEALKVKCPNMPSDGLWSQHFLYHATHPTPTALSSIEKIKRKIFLALCKWQNLDDEDHQESDDEAKIAEMLTDLFKAHIAEHYVPKVEVKELTTIEKILIEFQDSLFTLGKPTEFVANPRTKPRQQIEALIQDAVTRARIDELDQYFIDGYAFEDDYYIRRIAKLKATLNTKENWFQGDGDYTFTKGDTE